MDKYEIKGILIGILILLCMFLIIGLAGRLADWQRKNESES